MKLNQLFTISTGYTFRNPVQEQIPGDTAIIQAGDINEGRLANAPRIFFSGSKHLLRNNDILLSARGKSVARTVTPDLLPAVAASSVIILRPVDMRTNCRFVARYFNSRTGQAVLAKLASGAYIKTLRIIELSGLDIPLPDDQTQEALVKLAEAIEQEKSLLTHKQALYDNAWNAALTIATKGNVS